MLPRLCGSTVPSGASAARTLRSAPARQRSAISLVPAAAFAAGPFLRDGAERGRRAGRDGEGMVLEFGGL